LNLLAHAVLSPPAEIVRIGNVLADFVGRAEKEMLGTELQTGFRLHRRIDSYTDSHPVVERSKARLVGFQRYGNALIDIFYDHFLTRYWEQPNSVRQYTNELYRSIQSHQPILPESCKEVAIRMIEQDWMNYYQDYEGLALNLSRMESRIKYRTGRSVDLVSSIQILDAEYRGLELDFLEFWPQLVGHVS
jgi:acyl carrier protein phosphodiesterase